MNILINEANYTDTEMLNQFNLKMEYKNAPCLTISVHLFTEAQLEYLYSGISLELVLPMDIAEHFMYLSYVFEMVTISR